MQVQNDGPTTNTFILTGTPRPSSPIAVRVFSGYYDITARVLSDAGATIGGIGAGQVRTFAVQFSAPPEAVAGDQGGIRLRFAESRTGLDDELDLQVRVPA